VLNDPINFVDPSGEFIPLVAIVGKALFGATIGAIVEIGIQAINNAINGCDIFDSDNYDWGDVIISAGVGAVGPGVIASFNKAKYSWGAITTLSQKSANTLNRQNKINNRIDYHLNIIKTQVGWQSGKFLLKQIGKSINSEPDKCTCKK
jgi:hypothetical protein